MIIIHKYSYEPNSLKEILGLFQSQSFQLDCCWYYNNAAELNVRLNVRSEFKSSLESILCSYLASHNIQFTATQETDIHYATNDLQNYALTPQPNVMVVNHDDVLDKSSLSVLLSCLLKNNGVYSIHLYSDAVHETRIAVNIKSKPGNPPYDVQFAFGSRFKLAACDFYCWFNYNDNQHCDLLTLPYNTIGGCSLITGFGDVKQAVIATDPNNSIVSIGKIYNDPLYRSLTFTTENWTSSTLVVGAPGYGKTTLCVSLIYQAYVKQGIIPLVIEPKKDYRRLIKVMPELKILTTLRGYNPLIPPSNCDPYDYAEVVLDLLNLATEMPQDSPLPDYVRRVYYQAIKENDYSMSHFLQLYDALMHHMGFTGEATNFCKAGRNRVVTLFRIFCGDGYATKIFPGLDIETILNHPTVVEIGAAATTKMVSVLTYFVVSHVRMAMQNRESNHITNCLLIEEAHSVLSPILNKFLLFDICNILAEYREHGLSTIICDQSPSRIQKEASNLCGNVFSFRVISQEDQEYVGYTLGNEASALNSLRKQNVIARTNSMYQSEYVKVEVEDDILNLQPVPDEELWTITINNPVQIDRT